MDFVAPKPGEVVLQKTTISVFASTDLARRLTQWEINHLTVTGIQTEQCCETTTRDASDRGYQVDFVTDAGCSFIGFGRPGANIRFGQRLRLQLRATLHRCVAPNPERSGAFLNRVRTCDSGK